tara:strand:- start:1608 stop:1754 length:147 start_codon:yes stop_codon:yes gene_type:complete
MATSHRYGYVEKWLIGVLLHQVTGISPFAMIVPKFGAFFSREMHGGFL